jgi:hypothetical protein
MPRKISNLPPHDEKCKYWASMLMPLLSIKKPNIHTKDETKHVPSVEVQIREWYEAEHQADFEELYNMTLNPTASGHQTLESVLAGYIGRLEGEYFNNGFEHIANGRFARWIDEIERFVLEGQLWPNALKNQIKRDCSVLRGKSIELIEENGIFGDYYFEDSLFRTQVTFILVYKNARSML